MASRKLSSDKVSQIRVLSNLGVTHPEIARRMKVSVSTVWRIVNRVAYTDVK